MDYYYGIDEDNYLISETDGYKTRQFQYNPEFNPNYNMNSDYQFGYTEGNAPQNIRRYSNINYGETPYYDNFGNRLRQDYGCKPPQQREEEKIKNNRDNFSVFLNNIILIIILLFLIILILIVALGSLIPDVIIKFQTLLN